MACLSTNARTAASSSNQDCIIGSLSIHSPLRRSEEVICAGLVAAAPDPANSRSVSAAMSTQRSFQSAAPIASAISTID